MVELNFDGQGEAARCETRQTLHDALHVVEKHTGLTDEAQALTALHTVAEGLVLRLTAAKGTDLISQLPSTLHAPLLEVPAGPNRQLMAETICDTLAERLALGHAAAAMLLPAITQALSDLISPGEMADVLAQLPPELREMLEAPARV